jgi:hypothetical protein
MRGESHAYVPDYTNYHHPYGDSIDGLLEPSINKGHHNLISKKLLKDI